MLVKISAVLAIKKRTSKIVSNYFCQGCVNTMLDSKRSEHKTFSAGRGRSNVADSSFNR